MGLSLAFSLFVAGLLLADSLNDDGHRVDFYEKRVRPLLVERCVKCHGADKQEGGLRLDQAQSVSRGGDSGPVIVAGKPDESRLIEAVRQTGDLKMPPKGRLSDVQITALVEWIREGAMWPDATGAKTASEPAAPEVLPRVLENKVTIPDFHATILHLIGLDHIRLTYRHAGRDFRLTDRHGQVVQDILA